MRWDDPWSGNWTSASIDLDLYLYDANGKEVASSRDFQSVRSTAPPYEFLHYQEPHGKNGQYSLRVVHREAWGVNPPERIQLHVLKGDWLERTTAEGSISTPADSGNPGMLAVGAAPWDMWDKGAVRDSSSRGPTSDGRVKPDIVAADGGMSVALGKIFPGTSQAAPHVAGIAALVRQRYPDFSPSEVVQFLKDQATVPTGVSVPNNEWGYGFAHLPADGLEETAAFASVSAGFYYTCQVKQDSSVACWGEGGFEVTTPPVGEFASVSAGGYHTCGMKVDGSVACWGYDEYGQSTPPAGEFASVSAGGYHTCGMKVDGSVACWGYDEYGQSTPPVGEFASVSAGGIHTCGVKVDGSVACWGDDEDGQATPPAGEFASVSAGGYHTCGVRRDGTVACWGDGEYGRATPPDGEFASISAMADGTCGVKVDGSVACWGEDVFGRATPPAGKFASVSAGGIHNCGVRRDGSVACWGGQVRGLTQADFE